MDGVGTIAGEGGRTDDSAPSGRAGDGGAGVAIGDIAQAGDRRTAVTPASVAPAITALIVTYNHERYIRQALDSVLIQETNFPFEVIVSEDRSTDSTADIVQSYVEHWPDKISFIRSSVNLRDNEVLLRAMRVARGKYITFLDGDDYWVSPNKLQAQYDFMEAHPDCAITYHDVERVTDDGEVIRVMKGLGRRGTIEDLIQGNFLGTCSVMVRHAALADIPDWVRDMPAGDWPLYLLAARSGFVDHIDGLVSRYRIHGDSYWATRPLPEQALMGLCMQLEFEAHFGPDYAPMFARSRLRTARHILAGVLNEAPAARPAVTGDAEQRLQQAETEVNTARIRIFEMNVRVHEAEALRSGAEIRAADAAERLRWAEAEREEARGRAEDLAVRLTASEALAADLEGRLRHSEAETEEALGRTRAVAATLTNTKAALADTEAHARHLHAALETVHGHIQRIRHRERRAIAALGAVVVLLAAFAVYTLWP